MSFAKTQFVRDLKDKDAIASPFLLKFSAVAVDKNGKPYMNLVLMDQSGEIEARMWQDVPQHAGQAVADTFVWIEGRCQLHQGRRQIIVQKLQVLREDQVDPKHYVTESALDADALYSQLVSYVDSMVDPDYRALARAVLCDDPEIVDRI